MPKRPRGRRQVRDPFDPLDGAAVATLDLHGFGAAEAERAVTDFVRRVQRSSPGALVHIITGKGRRSAGAPVLKRTIRTLLRTGDLPLAAWGEDLDGGGYLVRLKGAPQGEAGS